MTQKHQVWRQQKVLMRILWRLSGNNVAEQIRPVCWTTFSLSVHKMFIHFQPILNAVSIYLNVIIGTGININVLVSERII